MVGSVFGAGGVPLGFLYGTIVDSSANKGLS